MAAREAERIRIEGRADAIALRFPPNGGAPWAGLTVRSTEGGMTFDWDGEPGPDRARWEDLARKRWEARRDWFERMEGLVGRVESWANAFGWATRRLPKRLEDHEIGQHTVPALLMQEGLHQVLLEPLGRASLGVEGVVDLYHLPAYDDVARLVWSEGEWRITPRFSSGEHTTVAEPLTAELFARVMEEFRAHAVQV